MYSSKEFEENLRLDNFEELENQYQETKEYFMNLNEKITCDEAQQKFPAFCFGEKELRIKFPTYFIRIIKNQISFSDLENLLSNVGPCYIAEEINVVTLPNYQPVHSLAVRCLKTSLPKNRELAEKIESKLQSRNIKSERCVTSGHYVIPIIVDEDGYITVK